MAEGVDKNKSVIDLLLAPVEAIREKVSEATHEVMLGILDGIKDFIVDISFAIALIGGGTLIILHVAGYENGKKWVGVLVVGYALIQYLLG